MPLTRRPQTTQRSTEDSSINAEEESEEKIADAKPPADDTVAVLLLPMDHHRNPSTIDMANAGEDWENYCNSRKYIHPPPDP
jgi:hypothetical protein